ncbi:MAG TPA: hypothetical protein VNI52_14505 [Sphingobacteriaceae bacterium]|nr:hypothetical protein [Sphingobacteriaceae bacterium]
MDIRKLAELERDIENFIYARPFHDFFMLVDDLSDFKPENHEGFVQEYYDQLDAWATLNDMYKDRTNKGIERIIKKIQGDNWEVVNHVMMSNPGWFKDEIIDQFKMDTYIQGVRFKAEYALDYCVKEGRDAIINIVSLRELLIDALKKLRYTAKNVNSQEVSKTDKSELSFHSHKIVLLHELGIIDHLRNKYYSPTSGNLDLSKLLNVITGIKVGTLRKGIEEYKLKGKNGNVFTTVAVKEVNKVLIECKIPTIE